MGVRNMGCKRKRDVEEPMDAQSKAAILKASPSFVIVTTHPLPRKHLVGGSRKRFKKVFQWNGIVIESEEVRDGIYSSTIITPATLFKCGNGLKPRQIKFDVRASDGKLYCGEMLACDFHFNLAALRILSESPLHPATLRSLNDFASIEIHSTNPSQSHEEFQLRSHSNLFKVEPGTMIMTLKRSLDKPYNIEAASDVFSASHIMHYDCKELYWVDNAPSKDKLDGGVINHAGEVVGIMLQDSAFLPSNFISRWWKYYKSEKKYCRPWVGLEIANLSEARLSFLEGFRNQFPKTGTGVVVTKVERDTPAYCSGMQVKDVIVKCDDKLVQSKMEFFEQMWDKAGESVELTVLRASDGQPLNLFMTIGDTTRDKFYRWELPHCVDVSIQTVLARLAHSEICSCKDIIESPPVNSKIKGAALGISPSVVSVITYNVPDDMILTGPDAILFRDEGEYACPGTGIIIETEDAGAGTYFSTILAPAILFKRPNGLQLHQIEIDVRVSGGKLYKGKVLACDFHYNLALLRIHTTSPLQPTNLKSLNDFTSIDVDLNGHLQSHGERSFQLQRHSDLFKVEPGTEIIFAWRACEGKYGIFVSSGLFSTQGWSKLQCKEVFWIESSRSQGTNGGGPVLNYSGEVIGVSFISGSFLPCNFVSRWWDDYKSGREFRRPWLGVQVTNLHEGHSDFLDLFVRKFPDIVTGVIVTEVEKDSPAYHSGIKPNDVIIRCDGESVRSKLEFFEKVWDNAGKSVDFNVLKADDGDQLNLSVTIGVSSLDNLYDWGLPYWVEFSD